MFHQFHFLVFIITEGAGGRPGPGLAAPGCRGWRPRTAGGSQAAAAAAGTRGTAQGPGRTGVTERLQLSRCS